eukprot:1081431-Alexandrium_andersonii.AAC.1
MSASLVGSEMCIRDRSPPVDGAPPAPSAALLAALACARVPHARASRALPRAERSGEGARVRSG